MKLGDKDVTLKLGDKDVTVALGDITIYSPVDPNSPKVSFYTGNGEEEPWELVHESYFPSGIIPTEEFRDDPYPASRVDIGSGITEVGDRAFMGCSMGNLNISNDVTTIGEEAFMDCYSIQDIKSYRSTAPSLGNNALDGLLTFNEGVLHVPQTHSGYSAWMSQLGGNWTLDNDLPMNGTIDPNEPDPDFGGDGGDAD